MTLIVSLRIPDGIVIAGDSLSTTMSQLQIESQVNVTCPECGHQHTVGPMPVGPIQVPSSTFSYAQKVFKFLDNYGVGTFGQGLLLGRTMHFAMRDLEQELRNSNNIPENVSAVADAIGQRALEMVQEQVTDLDNAPDDWYAVGFQVVGYDDDDVRSIVLHVGNGVRTQVYDDLGCTYSGQGHVVAAIWELYNQRPDDQAQYPLFSLQDAIEYAEFLIRTTAVYQQFSQTIPQVGGDIDVALVTPFDGFRWIKQKPLAKLLEGQGA
ncbi:MAG: hypothetical protein IIA89_12550 [Chloroflexi bacterium]|nr:hypothetical protein [Chloroflexota bacterium]